jgi:hypothetical protein
MTGTGTMTLDELQTLQIFIVLSTMKSVLTPSTIKLLITIVIIGRNACQRTLSMIALDRHTSTEHHILRILITLVTTPLVVSFTVRWHAVDIVDLRHLLSQLL